MDKNLKKYQNNNLNIKDNNKNIEYKQDINIVEKKPNHIILESKYLKSDSKKLLEQKVENNQEISRKKYGNFSVISGKDNLINSNIHNSTDSNEKPKEKYIRQNKENIGYRKINQKIIIEKEQNEGIKDEKNFNDESNKLNKYNTINDIQNTNVEISKPDNINNKDNSNNDKNDNKSYIYNSLIIHNIKSKFIVKGIFSYIFDLNFEYKLFQYSKFFQNRFDINLEDYKKKYLEQLYYEKLVDEPLIPSSSPLFEKLISKDIIYIFQDNLEKDKLRHKYFDILNKPNLNYSSLYYIFNNKNFYDNFLDNLEELNIDFNKIKAMTLNAEK